MSAPPRAKGTSWWSSSSAVSRQRSPRASCAGEQGVVGELCEIVAVHGGSGDVSVHGRTVHPVSRALLERSSRIFACQIESFGLTLAKRRERGSWRVQSQFLSADAESKPGPPQDLSSGKSPLRDIS